MGRGNACVHGDYEGLFYVDYDNFNCYILDEDGNDTEEQDYDLQRELIDESIVNFKYNFIKKYPNFVLVDKWIHRDSNIILENGLFYIAIEDNEWSYAVKLLQREDLDFNAGGLQGKLYKTYLEGIKQVLFKQFNELGTYGGSWTSGTIKRDIE